MKIPEDLRALFPHLSEDELREAKENLDRYILLAWEILRGDIEKSPAVNEFDKIAYDSGKGRLPKEINSQPKT